MNWIHTLDADGTADILGGKAHGLTVLRRLGLPVPPAFVINTRACREFLRDGCLPEGLDAELPAAVRDLEAATGRRFGSGELPLAVSVRSGAAVSMPGMMSTILNVGLMARLQAAIEAVFSSWNSPRAITYRELHDIPHDAGTAVVVQAMVYGNRDERSGSGVAFSRDPTTGANTPFGDVLFGHQGEDVVSGQTTTHPLSELSDREPSIWDDLRTALHRIEQHYRDACHVEFTFEAGHLWFLQVRPGGLTGRAAVRTAVDLVDEHLIDRPTALGRITPRHLHAAHTPRIRITDETDLLTRGRGACPGVASGRIAVTADHAARMAADGPVILVRPVTSPLDMHGLAAASGMVTTRGGPTSHAAVVARALGRPAVVDATALTVEPTHIRVGEREILEGTRITVDGTSGEVVIGTPPTTTATVGAHLHRLLAWADEISGDHSKRSDRERLTAAHARLSGPRSRR